MISRKELLERQPRVLMEVRNKLARAKPLHTDALWAAALSEVTAGFGEFVSATDPPTDDGRDTVYYHRFVADQPKWDKGSWETKPRAVDDGTSNSVNAATLLMSHVDMNTLDRYVATCTLCMRAFDSSGGFSSLVFDESSAYRRVTTEPGLRRLIPVRVPAGGATVRLKGGSSVRLPGGQIVFLEMYRLLFGEAGAVIGYCRSARIMAIMISTVLLVPVDHFVDDFVAPFRSADTTLVNDVREFVDVVMQASFAAAKWRSGPEVVYVGFKVTLCAGSVSIALTAFRRQKYLFLLRRYLVSGWLSATEARELCGRLGWAQASLFGRVGRAYLGPIHRRAQRLPGGTNFLNGALRRALSWWCEVLERSWFSRVVDVRRAAAPRSCALSYSDASSAGLGGVFLDPRTRTLRFWRLAIPRGEPIDRLEVEAAALNDLVFHNDSSEHDTEIAFVDNNAALPWITAGTGFRSDVDPMIAGMWLRNAERGNLKWYERVDSGANLSDRPSRGLVPFAPRGWRLIELHGVRRLGARCSGLREVLISDERRAL